jgi:hypothetical protein
VTPVVFFSHSSADNDRAQKLVAALEAGGTLKTTFDVRDLRQGEEWRPQLYKWIARCHAGVVLVTDQVMKRPAWVLQEATLLRSRAMLEGSSFRLFIVIDRAVLDSKVWKQWFSPLELGSVQSFVVEKPADDPVPVVAQIQTELTKLAQADDGYFARLCRLIEGPLARLAREPGVQDDLAAGLAIDDAQWRSIVGDDGSVQSSVAQHLCEGRFGDYLDLGGLFNELQGIGELSDRESLLGKLQSYWIPLILSARLAEAAGRLAPYAAGAFPPPNVVLVHAEGNRPEEVAEMYRDRQFAPYRLLGSFKSLPPPLGTAAELDRAVAEMLDLEPDAPDALRRREAWILDRQRVLAPPRPQYQFIHLEAPATPEPLLAVARAWWPCVFVVTAPQPRYAEFADRLGLADPELPGGLPDVVRHRMDIRRATDHIYSK